MRAREFIIKQNLNEEMLTEVDWNKVKSAILGGVLSLSALGAPDLQAKDISTMSGEEIKQYVIQNSTAKNKQEILDVINMLGQDRNREQALTAQPAAKPVATQTPAAKPVTATPAVKPTTTPAVTPTATPVATPSTPVATPAVKPTTTPAVTPTATPVATPSTPVATPAVKPTTTTPTSPSSTATTSTPAGSFDIKGLNWNLSGPEVSAKLEELGISSWNQSSALKTNPNGASNIRGGNLTYGGINFGQSNGSVYLRDGKLAAIDCDIFPSEFDQIVSTYSTKFGQPKIVTDQIQNKAGARFDRTTATFKTPDTIITIRTSGGGNGRIDTGYIEIRSVASILSHASSDAAEIEKRSKDFE